MALGNQPLPVSTLSQTVNRRENLLNNKYVILEEVGRGAYGVVRRGRDVATNEEVAIKEVKLAGSSQEQLQDVLGEIDLLKSLKHQHIVKYLDSFKTRTTLYIILEFMEKGDLSSTLKPNKFGVFPEPLAAVYIAQVLEGLAYLHEQGVVHRDIKGANILTTKEGLVKLADFGVATSLQESESGVTDVVGTPYWMAPEVIEMTEDVHPPLPEGISTTMEDFLLQCFHKEPNLRPDTRSLLDHPWIRANKCKQHIRATWSRTQGNRARGMPEAVHENVSSVVNRILQSEVEIDGDAEIRAAPVAYLSIAHTQPPSPKMDLTAEQVLSSADGGMASLRSGWQSNPGLSISSGLGSISVNPMLSLSSGNAKHLHYSTSGSDGERLKSAAKQIQVAVDDTRGQLRAEGAGSWAQSPAQVASVDPLTKQLPEICNNRLYDNQSHIRSELLDWAMSDSEARVEGGNTASVNITPQGLRRAFTARAGAHPSSPPVFASPMGMSTASLGEDQDLLLVERRREKDEIKRLIASLRPDGGVAAVGNILNACQQLIMLMSDSQDGKAFFIDNSGVVAILELLQYGHEKITEAALELLNTMAANDVSVLETLCLTGMIPEVTKYAGSMNSNAVRRQAALFVHQLCFTAAHTMQMLIACQGLSVLVSLVEFDYKVHRDLIYRGVSCLWHILEMHGLCTTMTDYCRVLSHHNAVERLVSTLSSAAQDIPAPTLAPGTGSTAPHGSNSSFTSQPGGVRADIELPSQLSGPHSTERDSVGITSSQKCMLADVDSLHGDVPIMTGDELQTNVEAKGLLETTASLLLVFSKTNSVVRGRLCKRETLAQLFNTVPCLEPYPMLKILRCIRNLTMDENMLAELQEGETIRRLVGLLNAQVFGAASHTYPPSSHNENACIKPGDTRKCAVGDEHQLEILHALNNLCRVNKQCQERAAVEGIVRPLCALAQQKCADKSFGGKLSNIAISMMCRLAHASSISRGQLWQAKAMDIFLHLTSEPRWRGPALDAIATWLAEDLIRIEPVLLQTGAIKQVTDVFEIWRKQQQRDGANVREMKGLLEVFHRILTTSRRLNIALSSGPLPGLVVAMLESERPMTLLPLLKILRSLYEAHNHPKEFIIQHGILPTIESLAQGEKNHKMAVVAKQAQNLLDAFQINSIM